MSPDRSASDAGDRPAGLTSATGGSACSAEVIPTRACLPATGYSSRMGRETEVGQVAQQTGPGQVFKVMKPFRRPLLRSRRPR